MIMTQRCQAIPYRLTTKSQAHPPFAPFVNHVTGHNTVYNNTFSKMPNVLSYFIYVSKRPSTKTEV